MDNKPLRSKIIIEFQPKPDGEKGELQMKVETHVQYRDMRHLPAVFQNALSEIMTDFINENLKADLPCESKPDLN